MQHRNSSLISMAYQRAGLILLVMLLTVAINLVVTSHYTNQANTKNVERMAEEQAVLISQQMELFRNVLRHVSTRQEVQDMLLMSAEDLAHEWAANTRHYLPSSVGLALLTPEHTILGVPVDLRVGERCLADLRDRFAGVPVPQPPVHQANPKLRHFDLIETVADQTGQPLGLVFASFSLDQLQAVLAGIVKEDQRLILTDGMGHIIAEAGGLDADAGGALSRQVAVPGTTWRLELAQLPPDNTPIYLAQGGTSLLAYSIIVVLVLLLTTQLIRIFMGEFGRIHALLERVESHQPLGPSDGTYRETADIVPLIQKIAGSIQQQQSTLIQQSLTDELTGLPNRRHFMVEMRRSIELAKRGVSVGLVLLDVDHFKNINDTGGHAIGDLLLQSLAAAMKENARGTDFVARLGGDEFAAILLNLGPGDGQAWFERLNDILSQQASMRINGIVPSLSAGMACVDGEGGTIEATMHRADEALYAAKSNGRGRIEIADLRCEHGCG